MGVMDMANHGSANSPDCWDCYVFSEVSDDEVDARVVHLLSPVRLRRVAFSKKPLISVSG